MYMTIDVILFYLCANAVSCHEEAVIWHHMLYEEISEKGDDL